MFHNHCVLSLALFLIVKVAECGAAQTCNPPEAPEDGRIIGTPTIPTPRGLAYSVGDTIKFACDPGFGLAGAEEAICLGDGQFSEDPPFCAAITCKQPQVENGVVVANVTPGSSSPPPGVYRAGTTVTLRCNAGFTMVPAEGRVSKCQDSGQWSPNLATCKIQSARCTLPPAPDHVQIVNKSPTTAADNDTFLPGSFIEYRCSEGFETTDSEQIVCLIDGLWSETPPVCVEMSESAAICSSITLQNGEISPEKQQYRVGETATLTCKDGYTISPIESAFLMCIDGGRWSPGVGTCVPKATTAIRGATPVASVVIPSQTRSLSALTTPAQAQPSPPKATHCQPVRVQIGEVFPADTRYEIGTMITLFCPAGYKVTPSDSDWSMCQTSGNWYPDFGECTFSQGAAGAESQPRMRPFSNVTCKSPETPPHTRIIVSRSTSSPPGNSLFSFGARLVYACDAGYYLANEYHDTEDKAPMQIAIVCMANGNWSHPPPTCLLSQNKTTPDVDPAQVTAMFKTPYWNALSVDPTARFRACAWGAVAEVLPDPDNRYQAIVVCASGSVMAISSNCSGIMGWKSVIGPPRGIVGWSQDPFYAGDLDPIRRELYLTSSVKRLGVLEANLDIIIAAGLRGATVQPVAIVPGTKNGPQFEGIAVDSDARIVYSADSSSGRISAWSLIDGWPSTKLPKPGDPFQPRHLALAQPSDLRPNKKLLVTTDYVNSQLLLFLIDKDNSSNSEFAGTIAAYSGRCEKGSVGRPGRVTFDPAGNIVVADGGCGRVQIFAADSKIQQGPPFNSVWASKSLGQYVFSVVPLLTRNVTTGESRPSLLAGLISGEVVCYG